VLRQVWRLWGTPTTAFRCERSGKNGRNACSWIRPPSRQVGSTTSVPQCSGRPAAHPCAAATGPATGPAALTRPNCINRGGTGALHLPYLSCVSLCRSQGILAASLHKATRQQGTPSLWPVPGGIVLLHSVVLLKVASRGRAEQSVEHKHRARKRAQKMRAGDEG